MVRLVSGIDLKVAMYEPEHVVRIYIRYQIKPDIVKRYSALCNRQ